MKEKIYKIINDTIEAKKDILDNLSKEIWGYAETNFTEVKSSAAIIKVLEAEGFAVEKNVAGIPTAFIGSFGKDGPVIAVLGEYDALPNLSQVAGSATKEAVVAGGNGHGCGHNLLGVASLGAALGIKKAIEELGLKGIVKYYGCPAEEGGSGKVYMVRDGAFKGVDAALCWHPGPDNVIWGCSSLANMQVEYHFHGISSHAAAAPEVGRSALDAVELMNVGTQFLREHVTSDVRFHHAITNTGGKAPNVVQANASVLYLIRAPKLAQVNEVGARIEKIANGAAMMTETKVVKEFHKAVSDFMPNKAISTLMQSVLLDVGPVQWGEEEKALAKEVRKSLSESDRAKEFTSDMLDKIGKEIEKASYEKDLADFIYPYDADSMDGKILSGSSDTGDVSLNVPMAQCIISTFPRQTAAHTWQWTSTGCTSIGFKGMHLAAKVLGGTGAMLLADKAILDKAKAEFEAASITYNCPIPADVKPRM